ncbi:hypothetical protein ACFC09_15385 [Streptomyces sp. NPDC056161]|uniref:hypothetical protein n=1 Tax=Streptomyces sp. NPDC056161 TaxID=3345732 RepID=UPI0035D86C92
MSVQPDEDEILARERLLVALGMAPRPVAEPGEENQPAPAAPAAEEESSAPAPRRSSPRLPDWWRTDRRPDLSAEEPAAQELAEDDEEPDELEEEPAATAAPASSPARADYRTRMREWLEPKRVPAEDDEEAGGTEDTGDTEGDGPKEGGPVRKTAARLRWAPRPRRRPRFAAAGVPHTMEAAKERRSLVEVVRSTPDHVVWMLYSGSALGVGFYLGWPQWVADGVDFLVAEHPSLTDTYSFSCYGLAAGALCLDYRARSWIFPVAWACRIPTASLVVGIPLSGDPTPISQMF